MLQLLRIVEIEELNAELEEDKDNEAVSQEEDQALVDHVHHVRSQNLIVRLSVFVV
jgi:hypothetical protein